jgi:hypothetical protein
METLPNEIISNIVKYISIPEQQSIREVSNKFKNAISNIRTNKRKAKTIKKLLLELLVMINYPFFITDIMNSPNGVTRSEKFFGFYEESFIKIYPSNDGIIFDFYDEDDHIKSRTIIDNNLNDLVKEFSYLYDFNHPDDEITLFSVYLSNNTHYKHPSFPSYYYEELVNRTIDFLLSFFEKKGEKKYEMYMDLLKEEMYVYGIGNLGELVGNSEYILLDAYFKLLNKKANKLLGIIKPELRKIDKLQYDEFLMKYFNLF